MTKALQFDLPPGDTPIRAVRVGGLEFIRTDSIDWKLLRQQKLHLLEVLGDLGSVGSQLNEPESEHEKSLTGILHLIDYLQEVAVDHLGYPENDVFTHVEED